MRSLPRIVLLSCVPAAAGPPDVPVWANEASRAGKARVAPKRSGRTRNAWDNVNKNATRHWPLRTRGVKAETRRVAVGGSRLVARAFRLFEPVSRARERTIFADTCRVACPPHTPESAQPLHHPPQHHIPDTLREGDDGTDQRLCDAYRTTDHDTRAPPASTPRRAVQHERQTRQTRHARHKSATRVHASAARSMYPTG